MVAENPEPDTTEVDTTSKFDLDGTQYEVPDFLDLDLDDWEIVWDEAHVALSDFQEEEDKEKEAARQERLRNPRVERAFIMVALRRARPDDDLEQIRKDAGRIKLVPYLTQLGAGEADPTSAKKPDEPSSRSSASSSESSSDPSSKSSVTQEDELATTGIGG